MSVGTAGNSDSRHGLFAWSRDINADQWKAFYAAFLGWTLDAMDLLLFAFAVGSIGKVFNLSETWVGALFSVTLFSSAFGGALFGIVSDYIGRVRALTYTILLYSAFTGLSAFAPNIGFLLVCRLILGLGMGGEWAAGMPLVLEHWPKRLRGFVSGLMLGGWYWGYLLAAAVFQFVYPVFSDTPDLAWRTMFWVCIVPALLTFWIRTGVPESPVWLARQKRLRESGGL
ncbi:MAG TPA: MFS transporter, partial [Thermodesulfobacteriota bacterium]|nr:MFS transporter [Thermodesulfobacteriota bacterium]